MIELETRICVGEKCNQEFRVMPGDKQIWHSVFCRETHEGMGWKTIKGKLAKKDSFGKTELAAPLPPLNAEESIKLKEARNRWNGGPNAVGIAEIRARKLEKETRKEASTITTVIGTKVLKDAHNIEKRIAKSSTKTKEKDMHDSKKPNEERSMQTASKETPQSGSKNLSTVLETERLSSMTLLNDSAKSLMDLAKDHLGGENSIKKDPALAIRALGELRNVMKTKLDYLKFGNEINGGK